MFSGRVTIESIDYERTLQGLYPILSKSMDSDELPMLIRKVLNKMDGDLLPVLLKFIGYMSESEKEALLLWGLGTYKEQIISLGMQFLQDNNIGDAVRFEKIDIVKMEGVKGFALEALDVRLDYALLKKEMKKSFLGLLKYLEGLGVSIFNIQHVNTKVIKYLTDCLQKNGIYLEIQDIILARDKKDAHRQGWETVGMGIKDMQTNFELPEKIEDILLDVVVNYLKDSVTARPNQ